MEDLPKLDPMDLYSTALRQLSDLTSRNIQTETMILVLNNRLAEVVKERDDALLELRTLLAMTESSEKESEEKS